MREIEEWGSQTENISRDVIQEALPCIEKRKRERRRSICQRF
jgi:hypothetical protein